MVSNFGGKSRAVHTVTISCLLVTVLILVVASMGSLVSARPLTRSAPTINPQTLFLGTATFGEYPQSYVGASVNAELLAASADELVPTGHTYSTYAKTELMTLVEYTYHGVKYAKLERALTMFDNHKFTDNEVVVTGNSYFFNVEPLVWELFTYDGQIMAVCQNLPNSCAMQFDGHTQLMPIVIYVLT